MILPPQLYFLTRVPLPNGVSLASRELTKGEKLWTSLALLILGGGLAYFSFDLANRAFFEL